MKLRINTETIRKLNPCLDRFNNWLDQYDSEFTLKQFLKLDKITHKDKLWVVLRLVPNETKVIFALDCAFSAAANANADAAAAYAAHAAAYAAHAADAAAAHAADAAAAYAAHAAAYAAAYDADAAAYAAHAARKIEEARQLEALLYLIEGENDV